MSLLQVKGLGKVYNTKLGMRQCVALKNISFEVIEGEFVAIMGASGSGKTTLLNILASLDKPTTGDVLLDGKSFLSIPDRELSEFRRKHLGFVFQDFNLLDTFNLKDNILLPLVLQGVDYRKMNVRMMPIVKELGIAGLLEKYPYEVSGGQKQRAAVARALITDPRLILADEPTGALDSTTGVRVLEALTRVNVEIGATTLVITHNVAIADIADRVVHFADGRIVADTANPRRRAPSEIAW